VGGWVGPTQVFGHVCELFCQRSYGISSKLVESASMCTTVCTCLWAPGTLYIAAGPKRVPQRHPPHSAGRVMAAHQF
jgi:hypothetical protein